MHPISLPFDATFKCFNSSCSIEPKIERAARRREEQDEPDRELPAADDDAGGDPLALLVHRRGGELQTHQG